MKSGPGLAHGLGAKLTPLDVRLNKTFRSLVGHARGFENL